MSPPPPPLGRSRRRGGRSEHSFDPALDDSELIEVRAQFEQGRWIRARTLLAATGTDWDRRGHRVVTLAAAPSALCWAEDWLIAEPESADAATLLACAAVARALRPKASPGPAVRAREACLAAARLAPADPTPWLALLMYDGARGSQGEDGAAEEAARHFEEIRARHPEHHHAHHLMTAQLAESHPESGQDPLHEVYDFASWAAEQAPADSPLAVLPVVAHAERYRVLVAAGSEPDDPLTSGHWSGRRARQVMKAAFDWWLEWERDDHPRHRVDLNFLAHAKWCQGRPAEAAALFHRIGPHVTPAPWSYSGRDPYPEFLAARRFALGAP
ncbi:hypothetical protein [Streptomyces fulvorobeus]|uniref:DUF4034 domain-containing protein n=1 Tax=Streptomyces fulvorobeus TaxID=284028 RepID=A0A7J0C133_9ACTN|nr:hypothetical protein [Streptomyces fulvorobeus]NYE39947.1 hypothetical protein [Streptomyces fulvorobeus]GFM96202.1 hypothetical protein Sfulv_10130 [Streptomyces fulvorobeus]